MNSLFNILYNVYNKFKYLQTQFVREDNVRSLGKVCSEFVGMRKKFRFGTLTLYHIWKS